MIPVRLFLRNFMSYGAAGETLDFTTFHTACLCGANGNGKSALLDAITWALWGMARGVSGTGAGTDDLIRLAAGADEAQVEFQFLIDKRLYRVVRTRPRGKTGLLDFQAHDGETFRPLVSATKRGTQALINQVLRMDYATFVNSAFLLQGRADEFTRKSPRERKEILAEILGLGRYDLLEARARECAREAKSAAQQQSTERTRLEGELAAEPEHRARLAQAEAAWTETGRSLATAEAESEEARGRVAALQGRQGRLRDLRAMSSRGQAQRVALAEQIRDFAARVAAAEEIVRERDAVVAGFAALEEARARDRALRDRQAKAQVLAQDRQARLATIESERRSLTTEARGLRQREEQLAAAAARTAEIAAEIERLAARMNALREVEARVAEKRQADDTCRAELARLEAQRESQQKLLDDLREKVELLQSAEARCPLCQATLTPKHRDEVMKTLRAEGRAARKRLQENAAAIAQAQEALRASAAEMSALQAQIAELPRLGQALGKQESELAAARGAEQERAAILSARQKVEARIATEQFAAEERARLTAIEREITGLGYDEVEHASVARQLQEQARFERRKLELQAAEERLPADRTALQQAQQADAEQQAAIAQAETEAGALEQDLAGLPALEARTQELANRRRELQEREAALRDDVTRARARVARYEEMRADLAVRAEAQRQAEQDAALHGELATAFSKDGVQALIIENAMPDLTEGANEILRRLTEGRMRVQFVTQKEPTGSATTSAGAARSGETLDLQISDELGTRRYELYSGGEAFRVDFAVRLALSRLLAHRAGTRLQTLIIDEGFGTQDRAALERLVQAIRAIQGDFERIVVITHIEELKEAFDTRIEVTKDEDGSHLAVFAGQRADPDV